ncbi:tetratricopeptide repeat protein [Streptomyces sp. NPDC090306]|uniref:tetratricopeptide repeat protein n=1 Tax=Streptomyces sp. NPDC090306 TaxID=3365961 RepID=UPI003822CB4D
MASQHRQRPSMQQLIRQRSRAGFVGRGAERAAFRANFDLPPEDERHRFLFHVHGNAGVGKTFLVREWEQAARERGALTAYVDENVGSVPEAMAALARQLDPQGKRFRELDRLLAAHRERRHEAEAGATTEAVPPTGTAPDGPGAPSPGSLAVARAGLVGLGMVPVAGAFAGAVDPSQLAFVADRLRAGLTSRLRSPEDVRLVLSPESVLTPVFLDELAGVAAEVPWTVLFLDTYERTGPLLDGWLHEVVTTDRHGALPANVVVVTAGQQPFDLARWGGLADFVADVPLGPFTEAEARGLLADKGIVAEPAVAEVLRLSGGLPLLVSTLAEQRPAGPDAVDDPGATAVERFLKWEHDPVRRAAALAGALPRRLDLDVFRVAVDCPPGDADILFGWLRGRPFLDDRGDRTRYHDLVRGPMLRLQRRNAPRDWTAHHERLAAAFARWSDEEAAGLDRPDAVWDHEPWRALRLERTYHLLCARPTAALPAALAELVQACRWRTEGQRWARALEEAGEAADADALRDWGRRLREALADEASGVSGAMDVILSGTVADRACRAGAHGLRGRELRAAEEYGRAVAEFERAVELAPETAWLHYGLAVTHRLGGDYEAALNALDRADALSPNDVLIAVERGETCRNAGRFAEAEAHFDRGVALDPADNTALTGRAVCRHALGRRTEALSDFDHALTLRPDDLWARVRRARLRRELADEEGAFADLDHAAALAPDSAWVASERGDAYRLAGRFAEAVAELGRAITLNPAYPSALASRGAARFELGDREGALSDIDHALALRPDYPWAEHVRGRVLLGRG